MAGVIVRDHGNRFYRTDFPGHEGHRVLRRDITLDTGRVKYTLRYTVCTSHREGWVPLEGFLGLPGPTPVNWYSEGFFEVWANGVNLGSFKPKFVGPVDEGRMGVVDFVWRAAPGWFGGRYIGWGRVRFLALPMDERLLCEVALQPQIPVTEFTIRLRALPSYRTSLTLAPGRRKVVTPLREVVQPEAERPIRMEVVLDPRRENWLLLCDEVFDRAKGKGFGPCGVLFLPEQVKGVKATITHYFVTLRLDIRPYLGVVRLAFWEFPGLSNSAALARLRGGAPSTSSLLRSLSFLPPSLERFDEEAMEDKVEEVLSGLKDWAFEMELRALPREIALLVPKVVEAAKSGWPDIPTELEAVRLLLRLKRLLREAKREIL
ncbi:MAG TPA: hypothetical protein EYP65_08895 [Armatimonadetes bacterium]|nr:hypothetical protein [Armatimonadota bacterium]